MGQAILGWRKGLDAPFLRPNPARTSLEKASRIILLTSALLIVVPATTAASLLTFDDIAAGGGLGPNPPVPNGYGELNWNGFFVLNGLDVPPSYGYNAGVVSPSNVVFNIYGGSASFSATSGPFGLNSAYLTAALNLDTPLNIEALGYLGTTLLYSNVYTVYRTAPTFVNFNYSGITQAIFVSSPAQQFAMDNLTITVPEPEPMLLLVYGVGVMVRWSVLRGGRSGKRGLARRWMTGEDR